MSNLRELIEEYIENNANSGQYNEYLGGRGYDERQAYLNGGNEVLDLLWLIIQEGIDQNKYEKQRFHRDTCEKSMGCHCRLSNMDILLNLLDIELKNKS